jgi:hypothetical protein
MVVWFYIICSIKHCMFTMQMKLKLIQITLLVETKCAQYCTFHLGVVILTRVQYRHDVWDVTCYNFSDLLEVEICCCFYVMVVNIWPNSYDILRSYRINEDVRFKNNVSERYVLADGGGISRQPGRDLGLCCPCRKHGICTICYIKNWM